MHMRELVVLQNIQLEPPSGIEKFMRIDLT